MKGRCPHGSMSYLPKAVALAVALAASHKPLTSHKLLLHCGL